MNAERCTWVKSADTGRSYSLCGVTASEEHVDELEICPNCRLLVEHVTWEDMKEAVDADTGEV